MKLQWEIHFLEHHFLGQNAQKKIYNRNFIALYEKTVFRFYSGPREVQRWQTAGDDATVTVDSANRIRLDKGRPIRKKKITGKCRNWYFDASRARLLRKIVLK